MNFLPSPSQKRSSPFIGINFNKKINNNGLVQKRKRLEEDEEKIINYNFQQLERSFHNLIISNKENENIKKKSKYIDKNFNQRNENEIKIDKIMSKITIDSNRHVANTSINQMMKGLSFNPINISNKQKQNEINHMMSSLEVNNKSSLGQSYAKEMKSQQTFNSKNNENKENENTFNHLFINTDLDFSFCAEETNTRKNFSSLQTNENSLTPIDYDLANNKNKYYPNSINACTDNNVSRSNQNKNILKEFFPKHFLNVDILNNSEEMNFKKELRKTNYDRRLGGSINWEKKDLPGNGIPGFHSTLRFRERAEFDLKIKKQKDIMENMKRLLNFC